MNNYSNMEYATRTLIFTKSVDKFLNGWEEMTNVGKTVGLTADELQKKEAMDKAIAEFMMSFNDRLGKTIEKLEEDKEDK